MNTVTFPGLNLIFNFSNIAFSIGNIDIYWYAVCIVFGITISLILSSKTKANYGIDFEDFLEIIICSLVFGIIGARLYYVVFKLDYYQNNLSQIINLRDGGLAIYGGILGGILTSYIVCKIKKISLIDFLNFTCPYLALAQGIGRIGNFFNIEAYGIQTNNFLRMGIESKIGYIEVHPCFLYEALSCFIIFVVLKILQRKEKFKVTIFSVYLILYGIIRFFIEGIRTDSLMIYNFRVSQIVSVIFIIIGIYLMYKEKFKTRLNSIMNVNT